MTRSLLVLSVVVTGLLSACAAPQPWPTRSVPADSTPFAPVPSPTPTRYPFRSVPFDPPSPYPTPEGYEFGMSIAPTQALPPGVAPPKPAGRRHAIDRVACPYYLVAQKRIGRYTVREWQEPCQGEGIATISAGGKILAQTDHLRLRVSHAGRDITGEGNPDVVVNAWDVGSFIWSSDKVYDLGRKVTQVMDTPFVGSDAQSYLPCPAYGVFTDLDGDGNAEYVTCDDAALGGYYNAFGVYPALRQMQVTAVLAYEPGQGYLPAGHRFPYLYDGYIDRYTRQAEEQAALESRAQTGTSITPLLALTMNYLCSGQPAHAWAELDRLYQGPYKVFLWSEIVRIASDSPFYTPAGSFPDLPVPDYYALQLGPGCVPDPHCASTAQEGRPTCQPVEWQEDRFSCARECAISFLQKGQAAGDPSVARRGIFWFEIQLSQLGVLSWEERLKVSRSEGGPCRIDIILEDTLRGHSELDTSGRFPGEVRRVNRKGRERASWRLRGDLTWEEVPP